MSVGSRARRQASLVGLAGILLLVAPALSIEPVFSNDDQGATRDVKVCILLLQATGWENPEPFFLPTLASNAFDRVRNLRPNNWNLVNPLAPSVVTPAIAQLWDKQTGTGNGGEAVIFDGVSGVVDNDFEDNGNDTAGEVGVNQGHYNGSAGNPYGPNSYRAHCQPTHLSQYGTGGTSTTLALPAVGQPVPKTHPAYWEVPLTPVTVSQLANFDAVFVNTHRNLRFTQEEQVLLRQFLDQGGTLYLEDSHGCRLEVRAGGDETLPEDVDFFLPFQFVDGFPGSPDGNGQRWDLYPVNRGGVNTLTPSKTVVNPGHPLLNALHVISATEADRIGDVRARDHLLVRSSPTIYLLDEVLRTTNSDQRWGNPTGNGNEPALAVARVGSGKLILSGMDAIDDCSKPYETGNEPDSNILPDIKFMFNLLAWKGGSGGDRRGGANNQGVTASQAVGTVLPRFVWHEPESWTGSATQFANIAAESPDPATLQSDPNFMLKEPLAVADGVVYLQYQSGNDYYLTAVDAEPSSDLDGDGQPDDGPIRDMTTFGATSDTLWRANVGTSPIIGATVVSVTHEAKNVPVDVLIASQAAGGTAIRLLAFHATVDAAQNAATPADTPGDAFYNWTSTAATWGPSTDGYVDLDCQGDIDPAAIGAPVVYNNLVYVTSSTDFGMILSGEPVPAGEYVKVFAVRMVPDPGAGIDAGTVAWSYPDINTFPEEGAPQAPLQVSISDPLSMLRFNSLKQVDGTQAILYRGGFPGPNFINGASASSQERHDAPADGSWQSSIVRAMRDPLHLRPTVGLARDSRTGLVTQTVFLNRANGDVFAVSAAPEALGWRINGEIEVAPPGTYTPPSFSFDAQAATTTAAALPALTLVLGTTYSLNYVRDAAGNVIATELLVDPATYRSRRFYETLQCTYTVVTAAGRRAVQEQRVVYPRQRLLRGNRHSGYEGPNGPIELLGWSTGAPMLLGADTVVSASSALWRPVGAPAANYEGSGSAATQPVGSAYQVRASGTVSFFDAAGDDQNSRDVNPNQYGSARWTLDPGVAIPASVLPLIDQNLLTSAGTAVRPEAEPGNRATISFFGSPVRYGDSVVVAGMVHNANSAAGGPAAQFGVMMGIDPTPVLGSAALGTTIPRDAPVYLLTVDPNAYTFSNLILSASTTVNRPLRHYLVDPGQYRIDYRLGRILLRADQAHLTRLADPLPDSEAASLEPFPEAVRLPLYGRTLWLVVDSDLDGVLDAGETTPIYVPSPIRWLYYPDTLLLDARDRVTAVTDVRVSGSSTPLVAGTDYTLDVWRPLLSFANTAVRGRDLVVTYTTANSGTVRETHRVYGPTPGFSFSPVVGGDKIFISGTQVGSLASPAIPASVSGQANGGLYSFRFGKRDHVVEVDWLKPVSIPGWPNFDPTGLDGQHVRGIPVAADNQLFVSFVFDGNGAGNGADRDNYVAPLYALGGSQLLVTESQRIARVDYEGRVQTQFTGVKERNGAEQQADVVSNNPQPTDLLTTPLGRVARAYNLPGDHVLMVDPSNDRVVETDKNGLVLWPLDSRTGHPDGVLRYLGLRNLGLNRPQDATRFNIVGRVHAQSLFDYDGDGTVGDADDVIVKDATVIADTGNKRVVMAVSHLAGPRFYDAGNTQSGTYTYYEPASPTQTGLGDPWVLTAPQVYNSTTQQWVEMAYAQVQYWDPAAQDNDPRYAADDNRDFYLVARVQGSDQLFNLDPDSADNSGVADNRDFDDNNDGVIDGVLQNLAPMLDQWTGGMVFRGLRAFHRFRVGQTPYLAVVQNDPNIQNASQVVIYEHTGTAGAPLTARWSFRASDYNTLVYDPTDSINSSYYERQLAKTGVTAAQNLAQRQRWFGYSAANPAGAKAWNPVGVTKLPNQNLLAIVNGSPNSVNQTASNSEVLLVRFDPNDLTDHRVEHILPDLSTTSTYPAGAAASQRRPETGSYPVSSPVHVDQ